MFMTKFFKMENEIMADRNELAAASADGFVDVSILKQDIYFSQKQG